MGWPALPALLPALAALPALLAWLLALLPPLLGAGPVHAVDMPYGPEDTLAIPAGHTVLWRNLLTPNPEHVHTVTALDGSFDATLPPSNSTFAVTFPEPGQWVYVCRFHPYMVAAVVVRPA